MKKILLATVVLLSFTFAKGQNNADYKTQLTQQGKNYFDIVAQKRAEFSTLDLSIKANEKAVKQFERWAYIWKDRVKPDGSLYAAKDRISKTKYISQLLAKQNNNNAKAAVAAMSSDWTQVGPVNNPHQNGYAAYPGKGRINVVTEDTNNTQILYAGAAAGGVWKTTDGGTNWSPKSDNLAGLGVTDILVDPSNSNIIYMATGDGNASHISSIGLFKSTNGGDTWSSTGLTFVLSDNDYIRDIAFAPGNSNKIFALTTHRIKYSTDAGATWQDATTSPTYSSILYKSIVFDPNNTMKVVVSDGFSGIWVSTNGGANFTIHSVFEGNSFNTSKLTVTPNDPDHFYAMYADGKFKKFRFAFDDTTADLISETTISGYNSQGGYNIAIAVSPTNKDNILVGGVRGYRSTDGGTTFSVMTNPYNDPPGVGFYVHPDHHHLSFIDGNTVLNGHDGGVHRGAFNATTAAQWTDLSNGLVITQSYNIAVTQTTNGDDFMMANQDNDGFSKVLKDGTRQWVSCLAGDGTATGIDYNTTDTRYLGGTKGALYRTDDGYASSYNSVTVLLNNTSNAAFVSPLAIHPTTSTTIYVGHDDVKKSTDRGDNFTTLTSGLIGVEFLNVTENSSDVRIFAISKDGIAKVSYDDGTNWLTITPPSGQVFNSFVAQPNTNTVYATVKGYSAGNKVYKSTDNGSTWTNMSAGLPNIIMKKIILKTNTTNETLFLGTELGIYRKDDTMTNWTSFGTSLPNVIVTDLKINYTDEQLYIGTFGRGMWKHNVSVTTLSATNSSSFDLEDIPNIYPNPASNDFINVSVSNNLLGKGTLNYIMYNTVGGIINTGKLEFTENKILLNNVASGLYMIRIFNKNNSIIKKVIIK